MKYAIDSLPKASKLFAVEVLSITFLIGIFSAAICAGLVAYYAQVEQELKDIIRFAIDGFAIAAGIMSISYIGYTVTVSTLEKRNNRTISYISRWNAGELPKAKPTELLTAAFNRLENKTEFVKKELEDDATRWDVVQVLCFLEEMALVVNRDLVDEAILREYYEGIVGDYLKVLLVWIEDRRANHNNPDLYLELTNLYEKWSKGKKLNGYF